jgi:hypothetical protein
MKQDFVDHHLILDTAVRRIGDNLNGTSALHTGFYRAAFGSMLNTLFNRWAFMPLGAGHGPALFFCSFVFFLQTFPVPGGRDQVSMPTVRSKYTVEPCQIDSRFWYK